VIKQLKRLSDEAFNAGKDIEAMKRLTLHRTASSLYRFIASKLPRFAKDTNVMNISEDTSPKLEQLWCLSYASVTR
jgi:hypothetical protein